MEQINAIDGRRRNLRIALFVIILATLPFYCIGIFLFLRAPQQRPNTALTELAITQQAIGTNPGSLVTLVATTPNGRPSITPFGTLPVGFPTLVATPPQFQPPMVTRYLSATPNFVIPTQNITATAVIFPTSTIAPSLTQPPTQTLAPVLPTETLVPPSPLPFPTDVPTQVPPPAPDSDGDGVLDNVDACPNEFGTQPDGCPAPLPPVDPPISP